MGVADLLMSIKVGAKGIVTKASFNVCLRNFKDTIKSWPGCPVLVDLTSHLTRPVRQISIWNDYLNTRRATEFLRAHSYNSSSGKTVLVLSLNASVYQTKIESMLAVGLMKRGWQVVVLVSTISNWAQRYFRSFGLREFACWEKFQLERGVVEECQIEAMEFLSTTVGFQAVKQWAYRGVWIGPQLLATVSRLCKTAAPLLPQARLKSEILKILPATLQTVRRAEIVVERLKPSMMYVNEPNYAINGAIVDVAIRNGVDVIHYSQPSRDDALIFKRLTPKNRRIHPSSLSTETFARVCSMPWAEQNERRLSEEFRNRYGGKWFLQRRNQPGVQHRGRNEVFQELGLDTRRKVAVVYCPVLWDANLFYGEDLFEDFGDWFVQTVRTACANVSVQWLIKLHPANQWKRAYENSRGELSEISLIRQCIGNLPNHVQVLYPDCHMSTFSLFQAADYGVTVRGTVGMELPCFGTTVLTAGTGRYSGLGFTLDSTTKEEYLRRLSMIQTLPLMSEEKILLAKRHAYAIFFLRPWNIKSFKCYFNYHERGSHPLDHNVSLAVSSFEEIQSNRDLDQWASWAETSVEIDFLCE